jgi:dATP pyrophosphohydrolase
MMENGQAGTARNRMFNRSFDGPVRVRVCCPAMPSVISTQIEVHLFRRRRGRPEFLLLRRAPDRTIPGAWQPVTGGIEKGETAWRAAAREVLEETGLMPIRWWALEHPTSFYDPARDAVRIVPVFAAEIAWTDTVTLSREHDRYAFASPAEASRRVLWGTQRRAIAAVREEILAGGTGADAREITERIAGLRLERPKPPARRRAGTTPRASTARKRSS